MNSSNIFKKLLLVALVASLSGSAIWAMENDNQNPAAAADQASDHRPPRKKLRVDEAPQPQSSSSIISWMIPKSAQKAYEGLKNYFNPPNRLTNLPNRVLCNILINLIMASGHNFNTKDGVMNAIQQLCTIKYTCKKFKELLTVETIGIILFNAGLEVNKIYVNNMPFLFHCLSMSKQYDKTFNNDLAIILIIANAYVDAVDSNGRPYSFNLVQKNRIEALTFLLKAGADVNAICPGTSIEKTLLHKACLYENVEAVKLILSNQNLKIEPDSNGGYIPLEIAISFQGTQIAQMLVDAYKKHKIKIPQYAVAKLKELGICAADHVYAKDDSCCICLEAYKESESISHLSCGHYLHSNCMNQLPKKGKLILQCPICRKENVSIFCTHKLSEK